MIDRDTPPILREHRSARPLLIPAVLLLCLLQTGTGLQPALVAAGIAATPASLMALAIAVTTAAALAWLVRWECATYFAEWGPPYVRWVTAAVGVSVGTALFGLLTSSAGLAVGSSLLLSCASALATMAGIRHWGLARVRSQPLRLAVLDHPLQAEANVAESRAQLLDPALSEQTRKEIELRIATELSALAALGDRFDALPEAREILERRLGSGHPAWEVMAAGSYLQAAILDAQQSGDPRGLERALELLDHAVAGAPPLIPYVRRGILSTRADALLLLHAGAEAGGDSARGDRFRAAAIEALRTARALAGRTSADRQRLAIELASITASIPADGGLDASVERCRRSLRYLRPRPMRVREDGYMALVDLLLERGQSDEAGARSDLAEALRLAELVARKGSYPAPAWYCVALLLNLCEADEAAISRAFRSAFAGFATSSFADALVVAEDWARWAARHGQTAEIAEAHWCRIRTAAIQSRRRLPLEGTHEPTEILKPAADAAFWLSAAGRPHDAVLALDLGNAVALSERMQRNDGKLEQRLYAAGRPDLGDHWRELTDARRGAAKSTLLAREATTIKVGRQRFQVRTSRRDYEGLADRDRLVREISRLPGFEDVHAAATYEDLREAAQDGPLVYLAAADDGGFAAIVSEASPDPDVLPLPALTSEEVLARAGNLAGAHEPGALTRALEDVLEQGCGRPRLAALSTWRPTTDGAPLGESVSLPSALLESGAAGVMASFALVNGCAAAALVVGFFERFLDGTDPARALAEAQAWLAAATNRELSDVLGALHSPPADRSGQRRARWERERPFANPACWAVFSYCGA